MGHRHERILLGQPEIQNLHLAFFGEKNIGRLQIAVHNSFAMRRIEGHHDGNGKLQQPLRRKGPSANLVTQRAPLQQFHGQVRMAVELIHSIDGADIRMTQCRRGPRFPLESFARAHIPLQIRAQELQGCFASQAGIHGSIHHAHPAETHRRDDPI